MAVYSGPLTGKERIKVWSASESSRMEEWNLVNLETCHNVKALDYIRCLPVDATAQVDERGEAKGFCCGE